VRPLLPILLAALMTQSVWIGLLRPDLGWTLLPTVGAVAGLIAWGVSDLRTGLFGPALCRIPGAGGRVALTFDDGPHPERTLAVAHLLAQRGLRATFFMISNKVSQFPEITSEIVDMGHEIGQHGHGHDPLGTLKPLKGFRRELDRSAEVFAGLGLSPPELFRPPVGLINPGMAAELRRRRLLLCGWQVRSLDTRLDDRRAVARVLSRVRAGDIVLLHDGAQGPGALRPGLSVEGLTQLLDALGERGLRCCTVGELRAAGGASHTASG
jgi:peptidoglycan/xylan/chitin deacetylase (PgdA/CDA1 family)